MVRDQGRPWQRGTAGARPLRVTGRRTGRQVRLAGGRLTLGRLSHTDARLGRHLPAPTRGRRRAGLRGGDRPLGLGSRGRAAGGSSGPVLPAERSCRRAHGSRASSVLQGEGRLPGHAARPQGPRVGPPPTHTCGVRLSRHPRPSPAREALDRASLARGRRGTLGPGRSLAGRGGERGARAEGRRSDARPLRPWAETRRASPSRTGGRSGGEGGVAGGETCVPAQSGGPASVPRATGQAAASAAVLVTGGPGALTVLLGRAGGWAGRSSRAAMPSTQAP